MWSSPNTHFIIGLAVGTRPWYAQGSIGEGARASGNTTAGIPTQFGAGIVVSGMDDASVQGNDFDVELVPSSWTSCPEGTVLASVSAGLASGSIQAYTDVQANGCMSDYSTSTSSANPTGNADAAAPDSVTASDPSALDSTSDAGTASSNGGGGGMGWSELLVLAIILARRHTIRTRLK